MSDRRRRLLAVVYFAVLVTLVTALVWGIADPR